MAIPAPPSSSASSSTSSSSSSSSLNDNARLKGPSASAPKVTQNEIKEFTKKLKGGYDLYGVYMSAAERRKLATETLKTHPIDLRVLNLSHAESQHLPPIFQVGQSDDMGYDNLNATMDMSDNMRKSDGKIYGSGPCSPQSQGFHSSDHSDHYFFPNCPESPAITVDDNNLHNQQIPTPSTLNMSQHMLPPQHININSSPNLNASTVSPTSNSSNSLSQPTPTLSR